MKPAIAPGLISEIRTTAMSPSHAIGAFCAKADET
jgi:hypothetical protein